MMNEACAEVHAVVVHAVPGFTTLPAPTVSLLSVHNVSVWLTTEPDEWFIHVDRSIALRGLLLTGGLAADVFNDRFASAIGEAHSNRKQQARSHAWLVSDVSMAARLAQEITPRELPEFAFAIDSVPEETLEDLERLVDSALGRVTAGLSIILGESRFRTSRELLPLPILSGQDTLG